MGVSKDDEAGNEVLGVDVEVEVFCGFGFHVDSIA